MKYADVSEIIPPSSDDLKRVGEALVRTGEAFEAAWTDVNTAGEELIEDIQKMMSIMQASKAHGPYAVYVHPSALGLFLSSDRRYIRRRARRLGVRFRTIPNTHPRVYELQLEKRA